ESRTSGTGPSARAATGGTKRMNVPARPAWMCGLQRIGPGVTAESTEEAVAADSVSVAPRARSAAAIRSASRPRSARRTTPGPSASAASTSARLVTDFEPGSETVAVTGVSACGAGQWTSDMVKAYWPGALTRELVHASECRTWQCGGMCGRYASARSKHQLLEEFQVEQDADPDKELGADYNVAPTKNVYAVLSRVPAEAQRAVRQLRVVKWGLVPPWAKDPSIGSRMINARAETLAEKPSYRRAFAKRRCLLPADGYFEWMPVEG